MINWWKWSIYRWQRPVIFHRYVKFCLLVDSGYQCMDSEHQPSRVVNTATGLNLRMNFTYVLNPIRNHALFHQTCWDSKPPNSVKKVWVSTHVPWSKHDIWFMVIHPTMGQSCPTFDFSWSYKIIIYIIYIYIFIIFQFESVQPPRNHMKSLPNQS